MSLSFSFADLNLKPELYGNLADLGYTRMTLVQAQTLPKLLAGEDVLARARTGSGKTAAFGLALLNGLVPATFRVQALVLCPTRELAEQVTGELRRLARAIPNVKILALYGGTPLGPQIGSLQSSPHIIVGTPGRILKHLTMKRLQLDQLRTLVLDEADRMLDMGFHDELNAILRHVPTARQTLLFSATYPEAITAVSAKVQRNPVIVDVTEDESHAPITQFWCATTRDNRGSDLLRALRTWGGELNLVFCNTKIDCIEVADYLQSQGIVAVALHGDLEQKERAQVLVRFANRSASVLIATDVAARGLDVKDIDAVFNYELPKHAEVYVHRIGRTARAGKTGIAISMVEQREEWRMQKIEDYLPGVLLQQRKIPDASRPAHANDPLVPAMTTIQISGGRKNKLRPGDLLGALTAKGGVRGDAVGAIDLFDNDCFVAVRNVHVPAALRQLVNRPIKGRRYRARVRK